MLKDIQDKSIDEQGERMVPAFHKGALVYGEHITRYEAVADIVKGKTILDIASGSGYGSYIMASEAKKVYGVDVDKESVEYAQRNYGAKNIEYLLGSAEKIPLADDAVDVVVTFETLEHVKNYVKFIEEIKRVTKKDGIAIVSTPNDPEFPEGNHFHLHEFEHKELETLLKKHFKYVEFSYQYTWLYAALLNGERAESEWLDNVATYNVAPLGKDKALYFMVVCSDLPIPKNMKVKELAAISEHYSARREQEERNRVENLTQDLKRTQQDLERAQEELSTIYKSKGWRLLSKAYTVKSKLKK